MTDAEIRMWCLEAAYEHGHIGQGLMVTAASYYLWVTWNDHDDDGEYNEPDDDDDDDTGGGGCLCNPFCETMDQFRRLTEPPANTIPI